MNAVVHGGEAVIRADDEAIHLLTGGGGTRIVLTISRPLFL